MSGKIVTVAVVIAALLAVGALFLSWRFMSGAKERNEVIQAQLEIERQVEEDLETTELRILEVEQALEPLERGVPERAYIPTMLTELERTGIRSEIRVTGVRPIAQRAGNDTGAGTRSAYDEVEIEVTGRGLYDSMQSLLAALDDFPQILEVRNLNLGPDAQLVTAGSPVLNTTLGLRVYVFPADPDAMAEMPRGPQTQFVPPPQDTGETTQTEDPEVGS